MTSIPLTQPTTPQISTMNIDGVPPLVESNDDDPFPPTPAARPVPVPSSVWLSQPEPLRYEYKLEGLEHRLDISRPQRSTDYNNLPPDNYRFSVRCRRRSTRG